MVIVKCKMMEEQTPKPKNDNKFLIFMGIGFQMIAIIAVSAWLGQLIDHHYKNPKPYVTLALLLFGTVGSIWQLIKQVTHLNE